ncbi:MAG TPA: hypothetical protein VJL58_02565 [Pyrinomonadaceae bacterium]|nr:hypothetical protein [Pyrinomonadaceae bacterium]
MFRDTSDGTLTTDVRVTNGKSTKIQYVTFVAGKTAAEVVVHLPIFDGNNQIATE